MNLARLIPLALLALPACQTTPTNITDFFEQSFQDELSRSPQRTTYLGLKRDYDRLDDISEDARKARFDSQHHDLLRLLPTLTLRS